MSKLLRISLCFAVFTTLQVASGKGSAAPIVVLSVDFDADPSPTQSGFQGFGTPLSDGFIRSFTYTGLSTTYTQTGSVDVTVDVDSTELLQGRDRGAIAEGGSFNQSDLHRDFIQHNVNNRYMGIAITGLLANHSYDFKFWGYDDDVTDQSNKLNFIDYTSGLPAANGFIQWGGGPVTSNDQYSITLSGTSSATGTMFFQAHVFNGTEDPGSGTQDQIKINAIQISTAAIPEPSSVVLIGMASPWFVSTFRRRFAGGGNGLAKR